MRVFLAVILAYAQSVIFAALAVLAVAALLSLLASGGLGPTSLQRLLLDTAAIAYMIALLALPGFLFGRLALLWADLTGKLAYAIAGAFAGLLPVLAMLGGGPVLLLSVPVGAFAGVIYRSTERGWLRRLAGAVVEGAP